MKPEMEKLIKKMDIKKQKIMLIEEMSEVTQALCKEQRGLKSNLIEELADLSIVLESVIALLDCQEEIDKIREYKTNRFRGDNYEI